mmetsp:Transcript_3525/g.3344  ORF Transcript_3525/g.3344 Transcript_3525/m.3344 type:complete len:82 (-) Transcript_3525:455-700(-)
MYLIDGVSILDACLGRSSVVWISDLIEKMDSVLDVVYDSLNSSSCFTYFWKLLMYSLAYVLVDSLIVSNLHRTSSAVSVVS